ncbi:MAG: hypothetical protein IPG50_03540 [Myxococcales bacterium]|nr:hypothetical protein [Myxococcales bacterium]
MFRALADCGVTFESSDAERLARTYTKGGPFEPGEIPIAVKPGIVERAKLALGLDPMAKGLDMLLHDNRGPIEQGDIYRALRVEPSTEIDRRIHGALVARGWEKTMVTFETGDRRKGWRKVER